jgi:hypothetical protein
MATRPTNEDRAEVHAETIRRFWKDRGYRVDVAVVNVKGRSSTGGPLRIAEIVSDLVNGLPRGYRGSLRDLVPAITPPDPVERTTTRDCMTCGKPFHSSGIGNRMCGDCHGKASGTHRHEGRER